ncbi:MAG: potassium-transporting ATPase subunit C [Planctomycetes bacterium]|nr:potassium-transporting ATPase subunit C [Planctomycetota bacterium]
MFAELACSLRVLVASLSVCVVVYGSAVLGVACVCAPWTRQGSLLERDGVVIGSELVAQRFTRPEYVWPRPSAVDYAADASGGSNLSPAGGRLRARVAAELARLDATSARPAPAELVLASGSGLDPDLGIDAARWQAARVAQARGVPVERVLEVVDATSRALGPGSDTRLVNVLRLDLALDAAFPMPDARR